MDITLKQKFEFLCQINELQAAMALMHTMQSIEIKLKPTDREYLRFLFAVLRNKMLNFCNEKEKLEQECKEAHEMYDKVMQDCTIFGTLPIDHRLHMTIQYIMVSVLLYAARQEDLEQRERFVMNVDYRQHLSHYTNPSVAPAIRTHAIKFQRALAEAIKNADTFEVAFSGLIERYPLIVFQRNMIRFLNRVEDHLLGANHIDETLYESDASNCSIPVELFINKDTRYTNEWYALDESMTELPGEKLYSTPAQVPVIKQEPVATGNTPSISN
ncbi:hypothetical protein THRCLA_09989 [Thraustotheca clavata]|uniref:Uncharacterized protein n=1 Tax=Thraustotheca clavata TaxID=74557 RepID=A0A1V9YTA1_9STRA|nr:hypothetical protein THRCLA_09989 [Thraustotheca clavata]